MAGLFPGICNTQNVDVNGQPLVGAVLTIYQGGTLVLADCFQDIGLSVVGRNPMEADATGRLPIFYVADGVYRVRLTDAIGVQVYDYPQVPSIGASSSGGGGSAVDPTTIFQTGDLIFVDAAGVRAGWVRDNGKTIGSALSGATERANLDCQNLFLFGWNLGWSVVGGKGASGAADWAANKQITLPDKRGCGVRGLDDMGNGAAGAFSGVPFATGNATTAGSLAGENIHTLGTDEIPPVSFSGTTRANSTSLVHDHDYSAPNDRAFFAAGAESGAVAPFGETTGGNNQDLNHQHPFDGVTDGGGGPHNNVARDVVGTFYRKL